MINYLPSVLILLGYISFLVGYWFMALSQGQNTTVPQQVKDSNYKGGSAGVGIGVILIIVGYVWWMFFSLPRLVTSLVV